MHLQLFLPAQQDIVQGVPAVAGNFAQCEVVRAARPDSDFLRPLYPADSQEPVFLTLTSREGFWCANKAVPTRPCQAPVQRAYGG